MRQLALVLTSLGLSALPLIAQQTMIDSLRKVYQQEKDPQKKIDVFYAIATERSLDNPQHGFAYADSLKSMSQKAGYKKGLAMSYHLRGFAYDDLGEYEKALQIFQEELAIFQELNDPKEISMAYTNLGSAWSNIGRSDSAIAFYLKSLAIDESRGDSLGASIVHNNIGSIYSDEGAYDKAIEHFEKALAIRVAMKAEKRYMQSYNYLSTVYSRKKEYQKAEEYALKGLAIADKFGNNAYAGMLCNGIGSNFNDQKAFKEAVPWLNKALAYWKPLNNEAYNSYALYNLAMAYAGMHDGAQSLKYAQEGYAIAEKLQLDDQRELYYKALAAAYEEIGDLPLAFNWYRKYVARADSVFKQDNAKKVAEMEAKFETQKKEAQLAKQQLQIERADAQKKMILITAVAVILGLGGLFYFLRGKQQIKQRETEIAAQLEHAKSEKLREMDALKSTFFANVSHEFRTPLTLIISPLEQMINGSFQGDLLKYYQIMHRNGRRLLDLVNQLLDLSKLESGKLKLQVTEGDLAGFLRATAHAFDSLAVRNQLDYQVLVQDEPLRCYFDSDKMGKILNNLLSNAFKFTPEGKKISVSLEPSADHVLILIRDEGIGIPAEQIPHLFERFTKFATSDLQPGSGIGLELTKELVALHKGTIEVDSKVDQGTCFRLVLPIGKAQFSGEETAVTTESSTPPWVESPALQPKPTKSEVFALGIEHSNKAKPVVLIAEDNADVRSFIVDQLKGEYQVIEAENGQAALQKALETLPDLILSDIMMPEMSGTEFCELIKTNEKTSHIPVVLLTALAEQGDRLKGLETGADDYLVKPFAVAELQVRVANLLTGRKKLQEHYRKTLHAFSPGEMKAESMEAVFLGRVKEAVDASLDDENFSVVELGSKLGMSRSQLHRKLSALTGFSPNEVIRNMRLERARQLLSKKAGNASEVAYMTGFNSPAYFAKCFKDYFGISPSEAT